MLRLYLFFLGFDWFLCWLRRSLDFLREQERALLGRSIVEPRELVVRVRLGFFLEIGFLGGDWGWLRWRRFDLGWVFLRWSLLGLAGWRAGDGRSDGRSFLGLVSNWFSRCRIGFGRLRFASYWLWILGWSDKIILMSWRLIFHGFHIASDIYRVGQLIEPSAEQVAH